MTLKNQLDYIKKVCPELTVCVVVKLFGISDNRYYGTYKSQKISIEKPLPPPSRQLFLEAEKNGIIKFIYTHQIENDCLTGKNNRLSAAQLYKARTGLDKYFTRDCLLNFRMLH